jgi:nitrogenase molybdenum-iron protein alpha/beta subunit
LEAGYAKAVSSVIQSIVDSHRPASDGPSKTAAMTINILPGPHLTPADCSELREMAADFGLAAIILPDLSALDGSRQEFSPLASGGTTLAAIANMGQSEHTIALGMTMGQPARLLQQKTNVACSVLPVCAGLEGTDALLQLLSRISRRQIPAKFERQRRVLGDSMRDLHAHFSGKSVCLALDNDLAVQTSAWLHEMGAVVELAVVPSLSESTGIIQAGEVVIGDLFSVRGTFDLFVASSHAEDTAGKLKAPHYEIGFPVYKSFGYTSRVTIGYRGTLGAIHDAANLMSRHSYPHIGKQGGQDESSIRHHKRHHG